MNSQFLCLYSLSLSLTHTHTHSHTHTKKSRISDLWTRFTVMISAFF
uniref:Uncharacterized protein n=1 Tax=Anguilla anguilla TaxID=7936 RepID=A0A0E9VZF7_ANGAN